jgi:hypothetical protein
MTFKPDQNYTADEVAASFRCKVQRIHELARLKILPCFYLGRQIRFSGAELLAFVGAGGKRLDGPGGWRRCGRDAA